MFRDFKPQRDRLYPGTNPPLYVVESVCRGKVIVPTLLPLTNALTHIGERREKYPELDHRMRCA